MGSQRIRHDLATEQQQCKEMDGSCFKNPRTLQKFLEKPFSKKDEGGVRRVVANVLVLKPWFLKSGHCQVTKFP